MSIICAGRLIEGDGTPVAETTITFTAIKTVTVVATGFEIPKTTTFNAATDSLGNYSVNLENGAFSISLSKGSWSYLYPLHITIDGGTTSPSSINELLAYDGTTVSEAQAILDQAVLAKNQAVLATETVQIFRINAISDLVNFAPPIGAHSIFIADKDHGGTLNYRAGLARTIHDGVRYFDPLVDMSNWGVGSSTYISTNAGLGVYERVEAGVIDLGKAGAIPIKGFDSSVAFNACTSRGIPVSYNSGGYYLSNPIELYSGTHIECEVYRVSTLIMNDSANCDMFRVHNFDEMTLTGKTTADGAVSFITLKNIVGDGNKSNNALGYGLRYYGARIMMYNCLLHRFAQTGMYTEYSDTIGSSSAEGQEEAYIDQLILRDNGNIGWLNRGPHNMSIGWVVSAYNGEWGYKSETLAEKYDGNVSSIEIMHTYANGSDLGMSIGSVTTAETLIVDGDNLEVTASSCNFDRIKSVFGGGADHAVDISGNENIIGAIDVSMWNTSIDKNALTLTGNDNVVGSCKLRDNGDNKGANISGSNNRIDGINIKGFNDQFRYGLKNTGNGTSLTGKVADCNTLLDIASANVTGFNDYNLFLSCLDGQTAVSGSPRLSDIVSCRASTSGGSKFSRHFGLTPSVLLDTTGQQSFTIDHNMLFAPQREKVLFNLVKSSNVNDFTVQYMRLKETPTPTQLTVEIKLSSASASSGAIANLTTNITY